VSRTPGPPLHAFVESLWFCENDPRPHALERVLPSGTAQLIINLKEDQTCTYDTESGEAVTASGSIFGVQSRYCIIDTTEQECVAGVVFKPGGTVPFFRIPVYEACDVDVPLDVLWGRCAGELREQLLEARGPQDKLDALERALTSRFRLTAPHPAVGFALASFGHEASVSAVTDVIGLSPKRFIERFKEAVGVTPKHYCRILRFQRALACSESGRYVDWTRVAMDAGYFDQAHFIHDFRSFAGITPTMYQASRTDFRNHVKFLQSAAAAS